MLQNIAFSQFKIRSTGSCLPNQKNDEGHVWNKPWLIVLLFWCLMPLSSLPAFSLRTVFISRKVKKNKQVVASAKWIYHSYISVVAGMLSHWGKLASPFLYSACTCRLLIFVARLLSHWRLSCILFVAHYIFSNMQLKCYFMYNKVRKCRREDQRT